MTPVIVVAMSGNRVIGRAGGLPWHLPTDLQRFRDITIGGTVIMGRKTHESILAARRGRPLSGRRSIVVTRGRAAFDAAGCEVANSLAEAYELAGTGDDAYVVGGSQLYWEALPTVNKILMTLVQGSYDGDVRFPYTDPREWKLTERSRMHFENDHLFEFVTMERQP